MDRVGRAMFSARFTRPGLWLLRWYLDCKRQGPHAESNAFCLVLGKYASKRFKYTRSTASARKDLVNFVDFFRSDVKYNASHKKLMAH